MESENLTSADNQQERLDAYIAGFVDEEGTFHVAIQRNPSTKAKWQLVPEFHVSQNRDRCEVLHLGQDRFGCGYIRENYRRSADTTLVFVVRRRSDLLLKITPFFENNPLKSAKQQEVLTFSSIVRSMERGEHLESLGLERLRSMALSMNGGGRYRKLHRPTYPESSETICQTSETHRKCVSDEDMVRSAWRHAEPVRNELAPD